MTNSPLDPRLYSPSRIDGRGACVELLRTCIRPMMHTKPWLPPTAAISATTRHVSRPARRQSTSPCSFAKFRRASRKGRQRPFLSRTSSAACAPGSARPRPFAKRPVCVKTAEGKPVEIGRLAAPCDRYPDGPRHLHPFTSRRSHGQEASPLSVRGPAGLACAHRLAMKGHDIVIFDARPKPGGLNEYGIASYKTVGGFAQAEVDWLMQIGGIETVYDHAVGRGRSDARRVLTSQIRRGLPRASALQGVNALSSRRLRQGQRPKMLSAFIARNCARPSDLSRHFPSGARVVVIGGGMTAVDAAVQSKLLGAEEVTIVYRRGTGRHARQRFRAGSGRLQRRAAHVQRQCPSQYTATGRCARSSSNTPKPARTG